ncbi:MarR family transcriptional regulator [uncultured Acetobacterium sp.]|uniref:MarR family winged helix-turn-helix transcriptional regulator n=1 Tax=uncultured Acetobacterium sp. TaxID=217139 RepID=UPI0024294474|nr:MarR family transcriptional regulator [uncultured Acetobacterium sp.]MBU4539873.1 MarR family transcriptional regulator [Bacillota bacterium]
MDDQQLKLENQLCFPLYASAKEVVKRYKPYLEEIGLTYTQYIVMMVLWEHHTINVKTLGDYLYLDSGTLTPLLKRLESVGLIERKRDLNDERNVIIKLTTEGESLKEPASQIPEKIKECLAITQEEAITLYRLLYKILENKH